MKKATSLLLALFLMLGMFVGCANETPVTPDAPVAETPTEPTETPAEEPAEDLTETPAETPTEVPAESPAAPAPVSGNTIYNIYGYDCAIPNAAIEGVELPLCNEPQEISFAAVWTSNFFSNPGELYPAQWMEEKTNVHVNYTALSSNEQMQLLFVSEDYTDLLRAGNSTYTGGVDKAVEDEVYVDMAAYMDIMPVWTSWLATNESIDKGSKTDTGIYSCYAVQGIAEPCWAGAAVRGDWLEDCGLDTPVTYDDWHEMLVAFKEQKGATKPLALTATGYDTVGYALVAGYDIVSDFYQVDGVVKYGFAEEGMRSYLTMMNQWYSEGLIDTDFPSYQSPFVNGSTMYSEGTTGAWDWAPAMFFDLWPMMAGGQGYMTAVTSPVQNEGDAYHINRFGAQVDTNGMFMTTAAVDRGVDELCAKWIDFTYTLDSAFVYAFGEEGNTWNYGEDALPHYTDVIYKDADYSVNDMRNQWTLGSLSSYYIWWTQYDSQSETAMAAMDTWLTASDAAYAMPLSVSLTTEEAEDTSSRLGDIQTYVDENVPLFIRGDRNLDEFDAFVAELYAFGLQDCIDARQAALDRYLSR